MANAGWSDPLIDVVDTAYRNALHTGGSVGASAVLNDIVLTVQDSRHRPPQRVAAEPTAEEAARTERALSALGIAQRDPRIQEGLRVQGTGLKALGAGGAVLMLADAYVTAKDIEFSLNNDDAPAAQRELLNFGARTAGGWWGAMAVAGPVAKALAVPAAASGPWGWAGYVVAVGAAGLVGATVDAEAAMSILNAVRSASFTTRTENGWQVTEFSNEGK